MTRQKLAEASVKKTSLNTSCLRGHIRHLSSDGLTCCSRVECPCTVFKSIAKSSGKERIRFRELGRITPPLNELPH